MIRTLNTKWTLCIVWILSGLSGQSQSLEDLFSNYHLETEPRARFELLLPIIDSLSYQDKVDEALIYSKLAVQIADEQNNDHFKLKAYLRITNAYVEQQLFKVAEDFALQVVEIAHEIGKTNMEAKGLTVLSYIYDTAGEYKKCLKASLKAAELYESEGLYVDMAYAFNDIGVVQYYMGDNKLAEEYYTKAQKIFEEQGDGRGVSVCANNLANIYSDQGDYQRALKMYENALEFDIENEDTPGQYIDYSNIGETYTSMGMYDKAEESLLKSLDMATDSEDIWGMTNPLFGLSNLFYEKGDFVKAIDYASKSLDLAKSIGAREEITRALENLYELYKEKENFAKALFYHEQFKLVRDSIYDVESSASIFEMQERFNSKNRLKELELVKQERAIDDLKHKKDIAERNNKENLLMSGLLLGGLMIALVSFGFVMKRKDNKKLEKQKSQIEKANNELGLAYDQIAEKSRDITDSIKYAQQIQGAILPPLDGLRKSFPESFIFFKPRDIVSGDFYWFHETKEHNYIAVADCTGHGVPGAFISMLCSNVLNQLVVENGMEDCGSILSQANVQVSNALKQENHLVQAKDGMDVCIVRINRLSNEISYAGAMNSVLILSGNNIISGNSDRTPIGGRTNAHYKFNTYSYTLSPGDALFLFTDGFPDQFGGSRGKKFKSGMLKNLLAEKSKSSFAELDKELLACFEDWRGDLEQIDDVCVLGLKV